MVIGVDAGALAVHDERLKVGVFRVLHNLFLELSAIDTTNTYRLYSFEPIELEIMQNYAANMENIVLTPKKGWFRLRLPFSLLYHPVDLFLGVSQAVPAFAGKSIAFVYDLGFLHYPEKYPGSADNLKRQTKHAVSVATKILTISEATKKDIIHMYDIPEDKIEVAYPGVDAHFSPNVDPFVSDVPYIVHVGSLKPGKNIPKLIMAFSQFLRTSQKKYRLLLIGGDFWLDEEILSTITQCGLEDSVRLLGYVPDDILPQYYRGASAFTSLSVSEGFCLPVLEAMACGVPVVASETGAIPELVPDQSLLSKPDDFVTFTDNLIRVIDDTELRNRVIAKGIAKAEHYTWNTFAKKVVDMIQSLT